MTMILLRKLFLIALGLLLLVGTSIFLPHSAAHAATYVSLHATQAAVSCLGDGCDGLDPEQTGCDDSSVYTAQSANIYDYQGNQIGLVELRFSQTCGTNWTRLTSYVTGSYNTAMVYRIYDGLTEYGYGQGIVVWSNMVYAPDSSSAWGQGCITMPDGASEYCAQTPTA